MQVAIAPQGAAIGDFDWRISLSAVTSDGAFSSFPGIDRTLCLVAGTRIDLMFDRASVSVGTTHAAYSFRGEADCFARLPEGPIVDLNIMTRRMAFTHSIDAVRAGSRLHASGRGNCFFVAVLDCIAISGGLPAIVAARDALRLDPDETVEIAEGTGWWIELSPA